MRFRAAARRTASRVFVAWTALACLLVMPVACGGDSGSASAGEPPLSTSPRLTPDFDWRQSDYVIRCRNQTTAISVDPPDGWRAAVGGSTPRSGPFEIERTVRENRSFRVTYTRPGRERTFHVRCLPNDFPPFRFTGRTPGSGPRLIMAEMLNEYAALFDRGGAPVWWNKYDAKPTNAQLMPDGTVSFAPTVNLKSDTFEVRSLTGRLIRVLRSVGRGNTDSHDLLLLPNGNYMLGHHRYVKGVDTTRFGGTRNGTLNTAQIQELRPDNTLVWKWDAYPRIRLGETGRWWPRISEWGEPYDIHHWNSVARRGNTILLSFRHLDAVYAIDRRSGRIKWKLGGTRIPRSLKVLRDPRRKYPFGGQHDARFRPGSRITVFDNATFLGNPVPRAVEYRLDRRRRTATLTRQAIDPEVDVSIGFGSARLSNRGNWTIGWGAIGNDGVLGTYGGGRKVDGRLTTPGGASYRANPVFGASPSITRLRRAMEAVARRDG